MKQGIHPTSRPVVFRDRSADFAVLVPSTVHTDATVEWTDGHTYPLVEVQTSSASHPFYTGRTRILDTEGRIEAFRRRYQHQ